MHDREAKPNPVGTGARLRAQPLKRLEETSELASRNHGSAVRDREDGAPGGGVGGDVEPTARNVVPDGVRDQVRDEALDQLRVASRSGKLERGCAPEPVVTVGSQHLGGGGGEVNGLAPQTPVSAARDGEQRREYLLNAV